MARSLTVVVLVAVLVATGCATQAQFLDSKQAPAIQTALTRGQFELNCPTATGEVLSREVVQPLAMGPWVGGVQRECTIGVTGCNQRGVFTVICPDYGSGCFAAGPRR